MARSRQKACAGISIRHAGFRSIEPEQWRRVIDTNLGGIFYVARETVRRMQQGVILKMSSVNGLAAFPHYADYNASKAAVLALTRTMAVELAPGIRVNALCPGAVMTPMQQAGTRRRCSPRSTPTSPLAAMPTHRKLLPSSPSWPRMKPSSSPATTT
nr:SDR family oxidoreductase [Duganella sp. Root336D2]